MNEDTLDLVSLSNAITLDLMSDAIPQQVHQDNISYTIHPEINSILDSLSLDEYKSVFFLLLEDYIYLKDFPVLIKKDKEQLKELFLYICCKAQFREELLVELFGTIKRFDILKKFGTCCHVFGVKKSTCNIKNIWKLFYSLCEEMTDGETMKLQHRLFPCSSFENLLSAEEVFCSSILNNRLNKTDISHLEDIFHDMPACRSLIKSYLEAERSVEYYKIKTPTVENPCGIAVIISHDKFYQENDESPILPERKGSHSDVVELKHLWTHFGFKTIVYENKTASEVLGIFNDLAKQDHTKYDVFVACYLSHGEEGVVYASNSKAILIWKLIDIMVNKCRTLQNKPKLFFIQACQGQQIQGSGCQTELISSNLHSQCLTTCEEDYNPTQADIPLFCDFLTLMSTIPGYTSFRSEEGGTWFVRSLVQTIKNSGEHLSIEEICNKVTNLVSKNRGIVQRITNCKQTVRRESTFRKQLKLKKLSY